MAFLLMMGTGIFTLVALGPKLLKEKKAKLTSMVNLNLYWTIYLDTINVKKINQSFTLNFRMTGGLFYLLPAMF